MQSTSNGAYGQQEAGLEVPGKGTPAREWVWVEAPLGALSGQNCRTGRPRRRHGTEKALGSLTVSIKGLVGRFMPNLASPGH